MEQKKKGRGGLITITCIVLVIALLFTGLGYPGFALGIFKDSASKSYLSKEKGKNEKVTGSSKAQHLTPYEGVTIDIPKNTMDTDRVVSVTRIEEDSEAVSYADLSVLNEGAIVIDAYDIDAGLASDERFPGEYTVTFDLQKIGVAPEDYKDIVIYRVSENGEVYAMNTNLNGSEISYVTDQNSMILVGMKLVTVSVAIFFVAKDKIVETLGGALKDYERLSFFSESKYAVCSRMEFFNGCTYRFLWLPEASGNNDKIQRLRQIEENYIKQENLFADEEYLDNAKPFLSVLQRRRDIAPLVKKDLEEDEEFQRLLVEITESTANIDYVVELTKKASNYLAEEQKSLMPTHRVDVFVDPNETAEGTAITDALISAPFIRLSSNFIGRDNFLDASNAIPRDNLLLTITHELFHICQKRYIKKNSYDNVKLDEATAFVIQYDAYNYFTNKGDISSDLSKEVVEGSQYYETFSLPMDEANVSTDEYKNSLLLHSGYAYSHFIRYLRTKLNKESVTAVNVMEASVGDQKPLLSETIKNAFRISDKELDEYYNDFCKTSKEKFWKRIVGKEIAEEFTYKANYVELSSGRANYVKVEQTSYAANIARFLYLNHSKPYALLLVPQEDLASRRPEFDSVPLGVNGVSNTNHGLLYPVSTYCFNYLLEIHGKSDDAWEFTSTGYDVWVLTAPDSPVTSFEEDKLIIELPEASEAAKEGLIDGYRVTITSDRRNIVKYYKPSAFGTTKKIKVKPIGDDDSDETFNVSVCEYIKGDGGKKYFGPESDSDSSTADMDALLEQMGALSGDITISMYWETHDDQDLHLVTPAGEIYYGYKSISKDSMYGELDVDMNVNESDCSDHAVENIYVNNPIAGHYKVFVNDFTDRTDDVATEVTVRVTIGGKQQVFTKSVESGSVTILEFDYGDVEDAPDIDEDVD